MKIWFLSWILFAGEVGVYLTVYDAKATNPEAYGSEHFYFMELTERLFEELNKGDFVKMRATLEKKGDFKGCYIERFEKGKLKDWFYWVLNLI